MVNNDKIDIEKEKIKFREFTEDEYEVLTLFRERMRLVSNSRIIKNKKLRCSVTISAEIGEKMNVETKFPDEDDLRSLLVLIRVMIMPNESIYFNKVLDILISKAGNDECKDFFIKFKKQYEDSQNISIHSIIINGEKYSQKQIFRLWLDGYYFHSDKEKREKLKNFSQIDYYAKEMLIGTLIDHLHFFRFIDRLLTKQNVYPD